MSDGNRLKVDFQNVSGKGSSHRVPRRKALSETTTLLCFDPDKLRRAILVGLLTVNARELNPILRPWVFRRSEREL